MEHTTNGQIGQPAACMIDSKIPSNVVFESGDYGPKGTPPSVARQARHTTLQALCPSTVAVDNFVGNRGRVGAKARKIKAFNRVLKQKATKILCESITWMNVKAP